MYQDLPNVKAPHINIKDQWNSVLKKLNVEYGNEIFNSWIKNIRIKNLDEDILYFTVPTRFIRDWITSHYLDKIIYFLNQENPQVKRVKINIDNSLTANMLNIDKSTETNKNEEKFYIYHIHLMIITWIITNLKSLLLVSQMRCICLVKEVLFIND